MKQDKAEAKAVASVLPYGLRKLQGNAPQGEYLAPDLVLQLPSPRKATEQEKAELVGPPEKGMPQRMRARWAELRALYVQGSGTVAFKDVAGAEWYDLPLMVRTCLLRVAGVQAASKLELELLACRAWQEMPPKERYAVSRVLRMATRSLRRTNALQRRW